MRRQGRRVSAGGGVTTTLTTLRESTSDFDFHGGDVDLKGAGTFKLPSIESLAGTVEKDQHGGGFSGAGLLCGVASRQGKRPYQEDEPSVRAFLTPSSFSAKAGTKNGAGASQGNCPETHFFGLFDGHAGGKCSKFLAASIPEVLAEDPGFLSNNLSLALKRSFHTANDNFLRIADRMKYQDGSTGISVVLRNGKLVVANVGDCRAVLLCGGKAVQLSKDQKPTAADEQKRIASLGGQVVYCMGVARVNGVLAVSRAFGNRSLRSVIKPDAEITTRDLTKDDDYVVLGSDGMFDVLRNKDVCEICYARGSQGVQHLADELVNSALARGSMDNVTCIVVRLSGYTARTFADAKGEVEMPQNGILGGGHSKLAGFISLNRSPRGSPSQATDEDDEELINTFPAARPGFLMVGLTALNGRFGTKMRISPTPTPPFGNPSPGNPSPVQPILNGKFGSAGLFRSIAGACGGVGVGGYVSPFQSQQHRLVAISPIITTASRGKLAGGK